MKFVKDEMEGDVLNSLLHQPATRVHRGGTLACAKYHQSQYDLGAREFAINYGVLISRRPNSSHHHRRAATPASQSESTAVVYQHAQSITSHSTIQAQEEPSSNSICSSQATPNQAPTTAQLPHQPASPDPPQCIGVGAKEKEICSNLPAQDPFHLPRHVVLAPPVHLRLVRHPWWRSSPRKPGNGDGRPGE